MQRSTLRTSVMVAVFLTVLPAFAALGADATIPLDSDGLPAWAVKQWTDFPVRIELTDRVALQTLLRQVPIASFNREQVGLEYSDAKHMRIVFQPRVTDAEFAALERAGYRPVKLRDVERENREASERQWADMYAGKAGDLRTDPLNYVPTNDQVGTMLQGIANDYPSIARYFSWGQSVEGRTLHGIVISDNVASNEAEPEVRYSSTMHGDEIVGLVICINLAYYLAEHYGEAGYEDVTHIVDNFELHIMPQHNPDGTNDHQRYNANGVDLNRNFPLPAGTHPITECENLAYMHYATEHHFVVSLNYHTGALVMNYPWDYTYTLTPDDAAIIELCLEYSTRNLPMYNGAFPQGITNGAAWYVITGSVQDWSYDQTDCIDVTAEVSNIKWPANSTLRGFWEDNREAMLAYLRSARDGAITGIVTDADTGQPLNATVSFVGNAKVTHTDPAVGDFYKLAETGTFDVVVEAVGYVTQTVTDVAHTWGTETVVNVAMQPLATGNVSGTVTDLQGQGLDATIEVHTWPAGDLIDSVVSDGSNGGAYTIDLFYGDYTLTASATDHFTESQQATVGATPVVVDFELGGMTTVDLVGEDFEAGSGVFVGDWIVETPGYESDQCLADSDETYPDNATLIAALDSPVSLEDIMDPLVSFMAKWNIENSWDAVFFEISVDGGSDWTPLAVPGWTEPASGQGAQSPAGVPCFDGSQANWVSCVVDLTSYIGETDVRFRFRLATDGSLHYDGFYFDDFLVQAVTEDTGTTAAVVPSLMAAMAAYPNPFNPQTTLRLVNPRQGAVSVAIFDVQGRMVRALVDGDLPAGEHLVAWDGTTDRGTRAGSGVYFARMITGREVVGAKLVLVK